MSGSSLGPRDPGAHELRVPIGVGLVVELGSDGVRLHADHDLDPALRADILAGAGEGLAAYARGAAVLHGSCVRYHGFGMSIVGPAGAGKSTLTAWFSGQGAELVSDGITLVEPDTRRLAWRRPHWRLRDDALEFLGRTPAALPFADPGRYKRRLDTERREGVTDGPLLDVVFSLEEGDEVRVVEVPSMEQLIALVRDWYLVTSLPATESPVVLHRAARLLRAGVRVARLVRPKQWSVFPAVAAAMSSYLGAAQGSETSAASARNP